MGEEGGVIMALCEIKAPNGNSIVTLEDWQEHAPPFRAQFHWKDGKSAKEFAKYVLENDGINKILEDLKISYDGVLRCFPEHVTRLPGKGNGRNHDLLIAADNGDFLIGVEAKTDESFGSYCKNIKNPSKNKIDRLNAMKEIIFGNKDFDCQELRYQLLSAAVGTILEAKRRCCKQAYLVVLDIVKKGYKYNASQMRRNKEDFDNFNSALPTIKTELQLCFLQKNID